MKLKLTRPICVFDLEATGTQITKDRIVQIGIIKIHPDGTEESFNKLVNPTISIPKEIAEIHNPLFKNLHMRLLLLLERGIWQDIIQINLISLYWQKNFYVVKLILIFQIARL